MATSCNPCSAEERTVVRAAAGVPPGPGPNDVQRMQHAREEAQQCEQDVDDQVTGAAGAQADATRWEADRKAASVNSMSCFNALSTIHGNARNAITATAPLGCKHWEHSTSTHSMLQQSWHDMMPEEADRSLPVALALRCLHAPLLDMKY